jgi:hypothetical protein
MAQKVTTTNPSSRIQPKEESEFYKTYRRGQVGYYFTRWSRL